MQNIKTLLILMEKAAFCSRKIYSLTHFLKQLGTQLRRRCTSDSQTNALFCLVFISCRFAFRLSHRLRLPEIHHSIGK